MYTSLINDLNIIEPTIMFSLTEKSNGWSHTLTGCCEDQYCPAVTKITLLQLKVYEAKGILRVLECASLQITHLVLMFPSYLNVMLCVSKKNKQA